MNDYRLRLLREQRAYRDRYQGQIVRLTKEIDARGDQLKPVGTKARVSFIAVREDANSPDAIRREVRLEFPDGAVAYAFADSIEVIGRTITHPYACPFCRDTDEFYSDGEMEEVLLEWEPTGEYQWARQCGVGSCSRTVYLNYKLGQLSQSIIPPDSK